MIATDPLSLVFIFCFLLGFGFFLMASLMGSHSHAHTGHAHVGHVHVGHAHAGHTHAPAHTASHSASQAAHNQQGTQQAAPQPQAHFAFASYLNPTTIALFLLGFGLSGYFFHNLTNVAVSLSLLLALIGGIVLAAILIVLLSRLFANSEGSTELDVVDRTGMLGKVSIAIPEKGIGEIIYTSPSGMHKSIPARGLDNQGLGRDQEVVVVNYQNGVAEVDTWEHFMHDDAYTADSATFDELAQLRSLLNESDGSEIHMVMRQEQQKE